MSRQRANGEGTVYEDRARGRWIGAVNIDGQRRKVVGSTQTEARKRLDTMRAEADRGNKAGDGNATLADAISRWETRVLAGRDVAPATRTVYAWCCAVLGDNLGAKRLRALTADDVEAMFDRLVSDRNDARPLSRAALIKIRGVLGQILDFAQRRGMVNSNVARIAELTPTAKRTEARRSLTPELARTLFGYLRNPPKTERYAALFAMSLTIGLRPGEAAGVLWTDLDLVHGTVNVAHAVRYEAAKPVIVDELKTSASRRTIALPAVVVDMLKAHRKTQTVDILAARQWGDDRIVSPTRHGTPLAPSNMRRELARICDAAGVPAILPNELRHTAASIMSDAGVPLEQIADVLGHETTRMLDLTYRHRVRPSIAAAVAPMDALLA